MTLSRDGDTNPDATVVNPAPAHFVHSVLFVGSKPFLTTGSELSSTSMLHRGRPTRTAKTIAFRPDDDTCTAILADTPKLLRGQTQNYGLAVCYGYCRLSGSRISNMTGNTSVYNQTLSGNVSSPIREQKSSGFCNLINSTNPPHRDALSNLVLMRQAVNKSR